MYYGCAVKYSALRTLPVQCISEQFSVYSIHSQFNVYTIHCTEYTHNAVGTVYTHSSVCAVYTHTTVNIVQLYSVQCTVYCLHCTLYCLHCTLYTVHCTTVQCTLRVQCILEAVTSAGPSSTGESSRKGSTTASQRQSLGQGATPAPCSLPTCAPCSLPPPAPQLLTSESGGAMLGGAVSQQCGPARSYGSSQM